MKTIRFLAASLLLITGVMHLLPLIRAPHDPQSVPMLFFGIFYLATGIFLLMNHRYSLFAGVIFPFVGLLAGIIFVGIKTWDTMLTIMFAIDAIVIVCCLILLMKRNSRHALI